MDLALLRGAGQVQRAQGSGVVVAARPRERERHHRSLLALGQEVEQRQPHSLILQRETGRRNITALFRGFK